MCSSLLTEYILRMVTVACAEVGLLWASGGAHGAVQPFSDEDASIETLSHCSSLSDSTSLADEGNGAVTAAV